MKLKVFLFISLILNVYFLSLNNELKESNVNLKAEVTQVKNNAEIDKVKIVNSARKKVNRAPAIPNDIDKKVENIYIEKNNEFEVLGNSDLNEQIVNEKLVEEYNFNQIDLQILREVKEQHFAVSEKLKESFQEKPFLPHREVLEADPFLENIKTSNQKLKKRLSKDKYEAYMKVLDDFNLEMDRRSKNGEVANFRFL